MGLKILVTGANGFVGSQLVRHLSERGHSVVKGDRKAGWHTQLDGCDAIMHLAAMVHVLQAKAKDATAFTKANAEATHNLAVHAAKAGVSQFLFVSTIGVHGNSNARAPLNEDSPIHPAGPYAASKWRAEQLLETNITENMKVISLRPPLIYGPGVKANFRSLLTAAAKEQTLPFGAVHNKRDYISVSNFCSALAFLVQSKEAKGAYLIRDGEALSTADLVRKLAEHLGTTPQLIAIAPWLLKMGAYAAGKGALYRSICGSREIDDRKLRALGWQPEESVDEALARTAKWYQGNAS